MTPYTGLSENLLTGESRPASPEPAGGGATSPATEAAPLASQLSESLSDASTSLSSAASVSLPSEQGQQDLSAIATTVAATASHGVGAPPIETTQTRHPDSLTSVTSHASARPIRWPWASPTYICPGRGARGYAEVSEKVTYAFCDFM
eukprot:COSAG06_NODE_4283_length_4403_cov_8.272368_2_plen_148_part_00